jgi:hypothetical protein
MIAYYSNVSRWTGDDLASIEAQIKNAQAEYQRYLEEYNTGMRTGSTSYAKRVRWPRVEKAQQVLDTLNKQKQEMLSSMSKEQSIAIVDTTVEEATKPETNSFPWVTLGVAVAALILIVVIVKVV